MSNSLKLNVLAFGAHPDDVDACVGGTLAATVKQGLKVGVIDLTSGDNSETAGGFTRVKESLESAKILGLSVRENLYFSEREFKDVENENKLIEIIRMYQPDIVMLPHWYDRHKGHRDASELLERAIQLAKYSKILPASKAYKVRLVLYYMIHYDFKPAFVFDISDTYQQKLKALYCHKSQIFKQGVNGKYTKTMLDPDFFEAWEARSRWLGYSSGFKYGEAFDMRRSPGLKSLNSLTNLYR